MNQEKLILVTGATGYVGSRLIQALAARGMRVRCAARRPKAIEDFFGTSVEAVQADMLAPCTLPAVLTGVDTAYYLVHSMATSGNFEDEDRRAAKNFGNAARRAGVRRIIYLGGLGRGAPDLSSHLRSRHEVGDVLRASGVPVIEFQASVVIGCGSLSFELVRTLVDRLPFMITPRWVDTPAQPIGIEDLLDYFIAALGLPAEGRVFEIGGADVVSYGGLMREYARQRGVKRAMLSVPVLSPRLSGAWLHLVAPRYARIGARLIDGLKNSTVVRDGSARRFFPAIKPAGVREAVEKALERQGDGLLGLDWVDVLPPSGIALGLENARTGACFVEARTRSVAAPAVALDRVVSRIGGRNGWYHGDWLWAIRGWMDRLAGGPGMSRGRRDPDVIQEGDVVDCYRVVRRVPGRELLMRAEMKLPGRAWLCFEIAGDGRSSVLRQVAIFEPSGVFGMLMWYVLFPFHAYVFRGMIEGIARRAEAVA